MPRRTVDQICRDRDADHADFLDGYAELVAGGAKHRVFELYPDEIRDPLVQALRGLAGSIRAGLVDRRKARRVIARVRKAKL